MAVFFVILDSNEISLYSLFRVFTFPHFAVPPVIYHSINIQIKYIKNNKCLEFPLPTIKTFKYIKPLMTILYIYIYTYNDDIPCMSDNQKIKMYQRCNIDIVYQYNKSIDKDISHIAF